MTPDATVNHATGDVAAAVKEATGEGVHVVVEHVGEATWKTSLAAVRPGGRVTVCGATSGPNPPAQFVLKHTILLRYCQYAGLKARPPSL